MALSTLLGVAAAMPSAAMPAARAWTTTIAPGVAMPWVSLGTCCGSDPEVSDAPRLGLGLSLARTRYPEVSVAPWRAYHVRGVCVALARRVHGVCVACVRGVCMKCACHLQHASALRLCPKVGVAPWLAAATSLGQPVAGIDTAFDYNDQGAIANPNPTPNPSPSPNQAGVGGIDSWGSLPLAEHRLDPARPFSWAFTLSPFAPSDGEPAALAARLRRRT